MTIQKLKITFFVLISMIFFNINLASASNSSDYQKIYEEQQIADFEYLFGLDPKQNEEYKIFMYSPYPLFRSGVNLIFKELIIPPGYYLLTPREKNGKDYILFKENGKVKFLIPAYKVQNVDETFYDEKIPKPRLTKTQKISKAAMDYIGKKWGKRNQRTPIPKAYIDFDDVGNYWNMILYYGDKKYFMIFKKD